MPVSLFITADPTPEDKAAVDRGISQFNEQQPEFGKVLPLCVFAKNGGDQVVAGAVGRTWGQCCELQRLWVASDLRGQGIGRELLSRFELEAASRGCRLVYLDTFTFHAPGFYEKLGYAAELAVDGYAEGISKFTMQKHLAAKRGNV